jgi:integrase
LAIVTGLRRGELFALRWKDIDEQRQLLTVREAIYDGKFSTPRRLQAYGRCRSLSSRWI